MARSLENGRSASRSGRAVRVNAAEVSRRPAKRFPDDDRGNVLMLFGLVIVPLLAGAGLAIDQMRTNQIRASVAEASDAALLAAARSLSVGVAKDDAAAKTIARKYFDANVPKVNGVEIVDFDFRSTKVGDETKFEIEVDGKVKTTILSVIGRDYAPLQIRSEAKVAPPRGLEVALVLDNTGSMSGSRIATLKTASEDLVKKIMLEEDNLTKVSVVPFGQYVNVGVANRNQSWIDVAKDYTESKNKCWKEYPDKKQTGTKKVKKKEKYNCKKIDSTCYNDGAPYSCKKDKCDEKEVWVDEPIYDYGKPVEKCTIEKKDHKFHGCVGSRNHPYNVKDENYKIGNLVPGLMDVKCVEELLPLSTNRQTVINKIKAMKTNGETYIPSGLTWGLRTLSADAPFTGGDTYAKIAAENGLKALVLMTDGTNTKSAKYPDHTKSNTADANAITAELCDEIKSKDIVVYTIAFEVTDTTIKSLLETCATKKENYYDATNASKLTLAFDAIANSLTELALTK